MPIVSSVFKDKQKRQEWSERLVDSYYERFGLRNPKDWSLLDDYQKLGTVEELKAKLKRLAEYEKAERV